MSPFPPAAAVATMAGMSSPPPKPRRWQVGERAVCSCTSDEWIAPEVCAVVAGARPPNPPEVERGGKTHRCPTAVLAASPVGRPPGPAPTVHLARVSGPVVAEMRRVIEREGIPERDFLERVIVEATKRFG